MYLEFFKFNKDPFDITPDPDFLFLSPSHKEASASIFYGIETRKGFVAVTGEVGLGKTTILRSYLEGTKPEKIRLVYIFNSAVSFEKMLKQICSDLGILTAGEDQAELLDILFHYLIDEYRKDHNVVLIIDEAQNMPVETLERLRVLTNLETSQDKLIQIILVGQPELEAKLDLPELRHLNQRIAIRSRIEALNPDESIAYIQHRLMRASSFHNPVFTKKAMKHIIKRANGVPRTINILCDNALVTAFGYQRKPVDEKIVKEVIRDFRGKQTRSGFNWKLLWAPAVVASLAVAVFVSANVVSRLQIPLMSKQSVRAKPADPLPAAVKAGQSGVLRHENMSGSKPAQALSRQKLAGNSAGTEKKVPAVTAVKPDAKIAAKPNAAPTVHGATLSPGSVPEGKTGSAVAGIQPAVVSSSKDKSAPAALTAPSASGSESLLQKAPGGLSTPAKAAQPNTPLALAPLLKGKPPTPVVVKKGDYVIKLLLGIYGKVDDEMLRSFKDLNPKVRNINKILVGEKIYLPQVEPGRP